MTTEKEKRLQQVREAKRTYRAKMREKGLREISVWCDREQEEKIKEMVKNNLVS